MRYGPLVSAIIPTYNRQHVVCEAIESILGQTYPDLEVIVVDDGSMDETLSVLSRYGDRIRVVSQRNCGPSSARNRGIAVARGEIIAFLDSDDIWLPTKIERQVELMNRVGKSIPCCLCNVNMKWADKELTSFEIACLSPALEEGVWVNPDHVLATRFVLFTQGIAIRREVLHRIGGFDESLRLLEDYDFSLRLSLEGPWGFIREPLAIWRQSRTGSLSQEAQKDEIHLRNCLLGILERHHIQVKFSRDCDLLTSYLNRELRSLHRCLKAANGLSETGSRGNLFMDRVIRLYERYRRAIFRRSPWFPRMKVAQLEV